MGSAEPRPTGGDWRGCEFQIRAQSAVGSDLGGHPATVGRHSVDPSLPTQEVRATRASQEERAGSRNLLRSPCCARKCPPWSPFCRRGRREQREHLRKKAGRKWKLTAFASLLSKVGSTESRPTVGGWAVAAGSHSSHPVELPANSVTAPTDKTLPADSARPSKDWRRLG